MSRPVNEWRLDGRQQALVRLGQHLASVGYRFVTPTPETYRRVNGRPGANSAHSVRDVFGWSRPFATGLLSDDLMALCRDADILAPAVGAGDAGCFTSTVRFSTLTSFAGEQLFVHSAYPTTKADAVFFGPDSYRFAAFLGRTVRKAGRLVDVGCGTGVGGLVLAPRAASVVLSDINPGALRLAAVNAVLAGRDAAAVAIQFSDVLAQVEGSVDTVIANPPYLADPAGRLYRDGGGGLGIDLSVRIVTESLARLSPGGQLVLYSGTPVIDGQNLLQAALRPALEAHARTWTWEELDPDVFGEELDGASYRQVERIAVVGLSATVA